jgi:ribosomal protein S18 acetylase RimI-like enzyme
MAGSPASVLLVATTGAGAVIGSLTLALFRVPTGLRAWIEDVVVDEAARGAGAGEALVREAVRRAGVAGAKTVDLTSRPSREAANRLYLRLGFEARTTNVYRYSVEG